MLIFDEVKTGFRAGLGGYQGVSGVKPDLSTFGKAFANGFPIAAAGGHNEIHGRGDRPRPQASLLVAGTYNCHPIPVAAAIACLTKLTRQERRRLRSPRTPRRSGWRPANENCSADHGVTTTISRIGSAYCVYFADHAPTDWWDLLHSHDFAFDLKYRKALIARGMYNFPVAAKQGSISFAHTADDIDASLGRDRRGRSASQGVVPWARYCVRLPSIGEMMKMVRNACSTAVNPLV